MNEWKKRKRKVFIPDMEPPKTYECRVCGSKIVPRKSNRYTAKERIISGGLSGALSGASTEPELYDCFDCPVCGCQFVAKERLESLKREDV